MKNIMKTSIIAAVLLGVANIASAITVTSYGPITGPSGVNWEGKYAYTWDVNAPALAAGETVTSAKISFSNIKLTSGSGKLWVDFGSVTANNRYTDNEASGDYFDGRSGFNAVDVGLKTWSYGSTKSWDWDISNLTALNTRMLAGNLGFLFDPDCYFQIGCITFCYTTEKNGGGGGGVPDGGVTAMLLGATMLGLGWARRKMSV